MSRLRTGPGRDLAIGLAALASVTVYVVAAAALDAAGFPLDDSWIHQTYARNLAQHGEWAFLPGEPSTASTSPLFTVLLAAGYALRVPHFAWTFALGALFLAGAGWINARLADTLFPGLRTVGLWTGLLTVLAWHLAWAASSGMEIMLFSLLALAVIRLAWRERPGAEDLRGPAPAFGRGALLGFTGAALTLTRPEGVLLLGLVGLFGAITFFDNPDSRRAGMAWGIGIALGWTAGIAPYAALNLSVSGELLPSTASAKQAEYAASLAAPLIERVWWMIRPLAAGVQIMLLPGLFVALYGIARQGSGARMALLWLPAVWAVAHVTLYALRLPAPYQHGRYVQPVLPVIILYGVGGTLQLVRAAQRRMVTRVLARSLALSAVAVTLGFWVIGAQAYAADVRIINTEMVAAARWAERHIPDGALVAAHDIGALGYYAPRPLFDLAGLVTPEVVPIIHDHEALMALMCQRGARYLMVLPDQRLAAENDPRLGGEPIFVTGAPYAPAAGSGNMAIYALDWSAGCGAP